MTRALPPAALLLVASLALGGCGSDEGGGGPQATVLESSAADFSVCRDTTGATLVASNFATGAVGDDERNDVSFLAGECRVVMLFDVAAVVNAIPAGTLLDSLQLFVYIASFTGNSPSSNVVIESIDWTGDAPDAFGAIDMSIAPTIFTPSNGGYIFNAGEILPVLGTGGLMGYRIRMLEPDPLNGSSNSWNFAMSEAGTETRAKLTYFWTR